MTNIMTEMWSKQYETRVDKKKPLVPNGYLCCSDLDPYMEHREKNIQEYSQGFLAKITLRYP